MTTQESLNKKLGLTGYALSKQECLNRLAGTTVKTTGQIAANRYAGTTDLSVQGALARKVGITNPHGIATDIAASRL